MSNYSSFAKSQSPYHTDRAAMGLTQSVWDTKRPVAPALTIEEKRVESNRVATLKRYHLSNERTKAVKASVAEREASITAFKPGQCANFTLTKLDSAPVHTASSRFATA